jgi:hypothetical protein
MKKRGRVDEFLSQLAAFRALSAAPENPHSKAWGAGFEAGLRRGLEFSLVATSREVRKVVAGLFVKG